MATTQHKHTHTYVHTYIHTQQPHSVLARSSQPNKTKHTLATDQLKGGLPELWEIYQAAEGTVSHWMGEGGYCM